MITRTQLILLAAAGSAAMLLGALGFQYIGDLPPCKLCIWQRWPHLAAVLIAIPATATAGRLWPLAGALAATTTGAIGIYHTGVERGWWQGPTGCTGSDITGLSTDELLNQIMGAEIQRCDEVAWQLMGLSMASWNAIASFAFAALWIAAAFRLTRR